MTGSWQLGTDNWSNITHRNDVTGGGCWLCWDFHRLNLVPIPSGTMVILR